MVETTVSYQCPNCGAPLSFHPGDARVVCAHLPYGAGYCRAQEKAAAKTAEEKEAAANAPNVAVVRGGARRDAGADLLCLRCRTGLQRKYDSDLLCLLR